MGIVGVIGRTAVFGLLVCAIAQADPVDTGRRAYVAGFRSGEIVRVNLDTGATESVVHLAPDVPETTGDRPRGVARGQDGNIYVGLRGGTRNVKRFSPDGTLLGDFTASIGGFGTGLIQFDDAGDLIVAGDISSSSSVYRYDGSTGALVENFSTSGHSNVVGFSWMATRPTLRRYSPDMCPGTTCQAFRVPGRRSSPTAAY